MGMSEGKPGKTGSSCSSSILLGLGMVAALVGSMWAVAVNW